MCLFWSFSSAKCKVIVMIRELYSYTINCVGMMLSVLVLSIVRDDWVSIIFWLFLFIAFFLFS